MGCTVGYYLSQLGCCRKASDTLSVVGSCCGLYQVGPDDGLAQMGPRAQGMTVVCTATCTSHTLLRYV